LRSQKLRGIFDQSHAKLSIILLRFSTCFKGLPIFRNENSPVSCGNRIFSTAFSFALLLCELATRRKKIREVSFSDSCATKVSSQFLSSLVSARRTILSSYTHIGLNTNILYVSLILFVCTERIRLFMSLSLIMVPIKIRFRLFTVGTISKA